MRKVTPAFDTNEAVNTVIFWKTATYPFLAGGVVTKVYGDGFGVDHPMIAVPQEMILFALRLADGKKALAEIDRLVNKRKVSLEMMERRLDDERRRSVLGQLDPKEKSNG